MRNLLPILTIFVCALFAVVIIEGAHIVEYRLFSYPWPFQNHIGLLFVRSFSALQAVTLGVVGLGIACAAWGFRRKRNA